ncbi:uncharacterized protein LOC113239538 [Hyposmocoma kahamanoa]|uniref:uncharacterized protein LOC113239538 n=1 Tax=Hyposmocoma kahamanoa TaxID=1477025 RepID=UPI000E6D5F59|nr:uncharacterized protein LOC113239538 [Hyposmocoma kahamanoa]
MCIGSIIDQSRVLTVAHCFEYDNFTYVQDPRRLRVAAGNQGNFVARTDYFLEYDDYVTIQWRTIVDIKIHEHFYFPTNDIAIILVNIPFLLNDDVGYIRPATRSVDKLDNCVSAGYANVPLRDGKGVTPAIMVTPVSVIPSTRCSTLWEINMSAFVCTQTAVKDMTGLDIGGPLVCTGMPMTTRETVDQLEGIVSGRTLDHTILFTRVSEYFDWLLENGYNHGPATALRDSRHEHIFQPIEGDPS